MSAPALDADAMKAEQRTFVQALFSSFNISIEDITTLPRCNNNFIHFVTFAPVLSNSITMSTLPGTSTIASGTTKAVFRVGNPAATFNNAVKVENTVAMMQCMRQALSPRAIIPQVYAWSKTGAPSGTGWILEQHMPGINIEDNFHNMPLKSQRHVLSQIAGVLKSVHDFKLPSAASNFGGLAFGNKGEIINGPFVVEPYDGPYADMKSYYEGMLRGQLAEADRSRVANGWRDTDLRTRLDRFASEGLESVLSKVLVEDVRPGLIIGDVVFGNFLFDPTTHDILALVDYDTSHTGHSLHEYFFSSFDLNFYVLDTSNPEVTHALFHGFPSPLPASAPPPGVDAQARDSEAPKWESMAMFEEELARAGVARPSNIKGAEEIAEVYGLMTEVCPFHFCMERWIVKQSDEKLAKAKKEQEETIDKALARFGF